MEVVESCARDNCLYSFHFQRLRLFRIVKKMKSRNYALKNFGQYANCFLCQFAP